MDFNLLSYVGVEDPTLPKTAAEQRRDEIRRKKHFDEMQYRAHVEQEQRRKERAESNFSGKSHRFPHRDAMHHHGNYWFAQGTTPSTFAVVGRAPPAPADNPIAHTIDGMSHPPLGGVASPRSHRAAAERSSQRQHASPASPQRQQSFTHSQFADPTTYSAKRDAPVVVLRSKAPPPAPAAVAQRAWEAELEAEHRRTGAATSPTASGTRRDPPIVRELSPRGRGEYNPHTPSSRGLGSAPAGTPPQDVAPYAQHYSATTIYESGASHPPPHADKGGIMRGTGGRDEVEGTARAAQRMTEDMRRRAEYEHKKQLQADLKRSLDAAISMKQHVRAEDRRAENEAVFGCTLPVRTEHDERNRREYERRKRAELQHAWSHQAEEHRLREEADARRVAPDRSMWWVGGGNAHHHDPDAGAENATPARGTNTWAQAKAEHEAALAAAAKAKQMEARDIEDRTLSANIANYADRIVLAEQQRKEAQRAYQRELDEQVQQKEYTRRSLIAESHRRDQRFSRGPFERYPSTNFA